MKLDQKRIARNVRKALRAGRIIHGRSVDRIIVRGRVVIVERLGANAPAKVAPSKTSRPEPFGG